MAKLSIAACAALFLLSAIVANPLNRKPSKNVKMEDIINQLKHCKEKVRMWTPNLNIIVVNNIIH